MGKPRIPKCFSALFKHLDDRIDDVTPIAGLGTRTSNIPGTKGTAIHADPGQITATAQCNGDGSIDITINF